MYYSYVEIEYVATSFSPARTDLALKLLRLRLEEYGPKIVFIKGIHNTIADLSHGFGMTPVSIEQLRATL
jgi:hypothetical protein